MRSAHRHRVPGEAGHGSGRSGVVDVVHDDVIAGLPLSDAALGCGVSSERGMPIEMVRGDVEDGSGARMEAIDVLQLERRCFDDDDVVVGSGGIAESQPDVAGSDRVVAVGEQNVGGGRGHGGLAVGAGHCDARRCQMAKPEFHLADEFHPGLEAVDDRGRRFRNARAGHNQILSGEQVRVPWTGVSRDACDRFRRSRALVVDRDLVSETSGQSGGRLTRYRGAEDESPAHRPPSVTARKSA